MRKRIVIGSIFLFAFAVSAFAEDVHHVIVTTPAGGQLVIENIPGAIPSPMTFSQTVIDAGQTVGGLASWSTNDKSALASLMANGTTDGCHRLYRTVNPPIEYECIGACLDCETITVVGGTSTGKAVLTLQPN